MSTAILILGVLGILIFLNGLFVAAEFSTVSARRTKISQMAGSGNRLARLLLPIVDDSQMLDRYIAACQLGITASSLVLGAFGQNFVASRLVTPLTSFLNWIDSQIGLFGFSTDTVATTLALSISVTGVLVILTTLQVIFGELFPKSIAIQYPERLALTTVVPVRWSVFILRPLIWFFNGSGNMVLKLFRLDRQGGQGRFHSPEEIELLVTESHEGGLLDDEERQMLRNAFRLRDLTARQVMVHRTRIVAAPVGSSVVDLLELALEVGHTRIPLYQDNIDKVIGFVHIKDLFRLYVEKSDNLATILREVIHVPETLPVVDVWDVFNSKGQYMAIVFDEFGGIAGLISFEDLIEEIFGELQDEFDDESALISLDEDGRVHLRGDLLVVDVNEYLNLELPDDADTLGGLILSQLGRQAVVGDEVEFDETILRVESMEDLAVFEVSIQTSQTFSKAFIGEWEVGEHV
ncbi:MAG: hemolysin family protein [Anaerolineae bacterium]|nr:MAG: hemolysin family protein [Anaerolineae bacterium]